MYTFLPVTLATIFTLLTAFSSLAVGQTRLTDSTASESFPGWSPDGTQVVCSSDVGDETRIWVIPAQGGTPQVIEWDGDGPGGNIIPAWSPDGSQIAFSSSHGNGSSSIYVGPATGGVATQITSGHEYHRDPAWSPDGKTIAFSYHQEFDWGISTVPAGGGTPQRIIYEGSEPAWSPDGTKIAYQKSGFGEFTQIWVASITGENPVQITESHDRSPDWSPDGKHLVFRSRRTGKYKIWVIPAAGGTATQLTFGPNSDYSPAWSPDRTQIVYSTLFEEPGGTYQTDLWLLDLGSLPVETNTGGVLLLHAHPEIVASHSPCPEMVLADCADVAATHSGPEPILIGLYAAFPGAPRTTGAVFGVEYDPSVVISSYGSCGSFEIPSDDWPSSGEGTRVTWTEPNVENIQPLYWFVAYDYYEAGGSLLTAEHPDLESGFLDDGFPTATAPVSDFGVFGFNGGKSYSPCLGACCTDEGWCWVRTESECASLGRSFQGDGTICLPSTCEPTTQVPDANGDANGDALRPPAFRVHGSPSDGAEFHFSWEAPRTLDSVAEIVDATGRRVLRIPVAAGATSVHWAGSRADRLPSGTYWIRWADGSLGNSRLVVLR